RRTESEQPAGPADGRHGERAGAGGAAFPRHDRAARKPRREEQPSLRQLLGEPMRNFLIVAFVAAAGAAAIAQQPAKPMSPEGSAATQVLGKWMKPERPAFTLGRENYT